ncbi:Late embryogenesis abundant (LEA) hydroxyproline-rich glycoproteinfamily [Zostera marina]|uniref:Late embryogenesis abundant (LEA) hydroxyproline-rich glycoproteinfamily n=1 Tax=Zostera marina TaxID=29655 RepID=A0A0K9Q3S4_ZOSMR|nr:Late embryogenesis abundant (LEA) hydroxyproline-rich glycoproteinfamily [Zostera marina]
MVSDCGEHAWYKKHIKLKLPIFFYIVLALIIFFSLAILISWLVLRPHKPQFSVRHVSVEVFNISTNPSVIKTNIQVSIFSRNPNKHAGIYYESLEFYATYRYHQITLPNHIPYGSFQGSKDVTIWSPYISGNSIPIASYAVQTLKQEEKAGMVILNVVVDGKIRWKIGPWKFGRFHLFVNCQSFINTSTPSAYTFQSQQNNNCKVDV